MIIIKQLPHTVIGLNYLINAADFQLKKKKSLSFSFLFLKSKIHGEAKLKPKYSYDLAASATEKNFRRQSIRWGRIWKKRCIPIDTMLRHFYHIEMKLALILVSYICSMQIYSINQLIRLIVRRAGYFVKTRIFCENTESQNSSQLVVLQFSENMRLIFVLVR